MACACRLCLALLIGAPVEVGGAGKEPIAGQDAAEPKPAIAATPSPKLPKQVRLPPGLLNQIRDHTHGIPTPERDAYYEILTQARDADFDLQRSAGVKTVAEAKKKFAADKKNARRKFSLFVDIIMHPDRYRGKPVHLYGYCHKIDEMDAGENDSGLKKLYQVWFYTPDSFGNPYVVVCTEIPPNLPLPKRGNPTGDLEVTGYFFKNWSFEAERGGWGAPLILAQRLEWKPPPAPPSLTPLQKAFVGLGVGFVAVLATLFMWRRARADRRFRQAEHAKLADADNLNALQDLEHE